MRLKRVANDRRACIDIFLYLCSDCVQEIVSQIGKKSFQDIINNFNSKLSDHGTIVKLFFS